MLPAAIEVRIERYAQSMDGTDERIRERTAIRVIRDLERTGGSVHGIVDTLVALHPREVRQQVAK